jgi:hypothetical protein
MTVTINAVTSTGLVQTSDGSGVIKLQSNGTTTNALAWVNFNGTSASPITPRASYNVTSVTKNGTGDYTVTFTNALTDANYSYASGSVNGFGAMYLSSISTTSLRLVNTNNAGTAVDGATLCVTVHGN